MPFTEPFRNFEKGDLVYGLHMTGKKVVSRASYLQSFFVGGVTIEQYDIINTEEHKNKPKDLDAFTNALLGHDKYKAAVGGEYNNSSIRMKDKGGLYWAATTGKYVNFVLDGLDMDAVVGKSFKGKNPDRNASEGVTKNRSVTGAELRWIYRNRSHVGVQQYIQFWYGYEQVPPPWVTYYVPSTTRGQVKKDGKAVWALYVPKSEITQTQ